jgi:hypothetical protein
MRKLAEVEYAKELMTEAMDWPVWKWLWEKPSVREAADKANAALDRLDRKVKAGWSDEIKAAYKELQAQAGSAAKSRRQQPDAEQPHNTGPDTEAKLFCRKVKQADDKAYRAHMDAEETFDEAERQMSTDLAREGCQKAIRSWELHEKAIRLAEAGIPSKKGGE